MKLLVSADGGPWWDICAGYAPGADAKKYYKQMDSNSKAALRNRAATTYEEQCKKYRQSKEMTSADRQWLEKVLKEGTQSDKISAMLLQIQEAPFYGLEWIAKLLAMASSASRNESYPALEALKEVFLGILPAKKKQVRLDGLVGWEGRVLTDVKEWTPMPVLLAAYFEDILRKSYIEYIKILEIALYDQVQNGRELSMRLVHQLAVAGKCEMSETLVLLLVNKLGDPTRKISSRAVYYLQQVVEGNEDLTLPCVKAIQDIACRPHPSDKPAFYGMTFFSQLKLTDDTPEVTSCLLQTYHYFLHLFIKQLEGRQREKRIERKSAKQFKRRKTGGGEDAKDADNEVPRVMKVVLLGLTRAVPFLSKADQTLLNESAEKLFSAVSLIKSFPVLLQTASLIYRIFIVNNTADGSGSDYTLRLLADLFCNHLLDYGRMAANSASHPLLFKLLYKIAAALAESTDSSVSTSSTCSSSALTHLKAMMKSLMSVTVLINSPAFCAASLLLLNEIIIMRPGIRLLLSFPDDEETAESSSLLKEVNILANHYHPIVAGYARTLLEAKGEIEVGGVMQDPFDTLSHSHLLSSLIQAKSQDNVKVKV